MILKKMLPIICLILFIFTFMNCESKGPAEKAGEKIDQAVEQTSEKVEEAAEAVKDKAEEAKEEIEKSTP